MRIRTAIFGVYVLASAVGLAVLMRFMLAEVRPRYVSAVRADLEEAGRLLAATLEGRSEAAAVAAVAQARYFQAALIAPDGAILAQRTEEPLTDAYSPRSDAALARRVSGDLIDGWAARHDGGVRVETPVHLAGGRTVRLVLMRSVRSLNAVIWSERKKLAGVALAVAGVMLVAGWWIAARLARALERLTLYAREVRDGRPARPPQSRAREIAALSQAFEEMRVALEGRQQTERYVQSLAHGVKAPLAAIRGSAELLDEDMPPAQRAKFLANIRAESARIERVIGRLLELSSLETRKSVGHPVRLPADEPAAQAVEAVRAAAETAGVSLVLAAETGQAHLHGDAVLLREALVNLLQNAVEFSPSGGTVTLTVAAADGRVAFTIDDQGAGVPDFALGQVFDRFYSLPRPATARRSTGLGLALVREIAHLHGGEAGLENRPDGGARAWLRLPAA